MAHENAILGRDGGQVSSLSVTNAIKIKKTNDSRINFKDCFKAKDSAGKKNVFESRKSSAKSKFTNVKKAQFRKNNTKNSDSNTKIGSEKPVEQNAKKFDDDDKQINKSLKKNQKSLAKSSKLKQKSETKGIKEVAEEFSVTDEIVKMLNSDGEDAVEILQMLLGSQQITITEGMSEKLQQALKQFQEGDIGAAIETLSDMFSELSSAQLNQMSADVKERKTELDNLLKLLETVESEEFADKLNKIVGEQKADSQTLKDSNQNETQADKQSLESFNKDEVKVIDINTKKQDISSHINKLGQNGNKIENSEMKTVDSVTTEMPVVKADKEVFTNQISGMNRFGNDINISGIKSMPAQVDMMNRIKVAQNIMNQVINGTKTQITNLQGVENITLRLKPAELGQVDLKISMEKGILMAQFQVESKIVKETLESNMADLKQALEEKGYSVDGLQVSVNQDKEHSAKRELFEQSSKRKYFFSDEDELEAIDFESINKTLLSLQSTFEYLG